MTSTEFETKKNSPEYAGFWLRLSTTLIDSIVIFSITIPLMYFIYGEKFWHSNAFSLGTPDILLNYVFPFIATVLFWLYKAATPGKMALKIKVVDINTGENPTFWQSILRYFGYFISILPFGYGFLSISWDNKKQGWHDKLSKTMVIKLDSDR